MKWLLLIYAFNLVEPRKLVDKFLNLSKASELRTIAALSGDNSNLTIAGPLLKPLLVPRVSGTESNKNVREFIIKHFELLGWHVELDAFIEDTPLGKIEFTNIVVTRDITAHKRLVMAAHYDSKYFKDFEFIGATDSSVPCAILMDIASTVNTAMDLKEKGSDRFNTLQMIFFDGEEAFVNWTDDDSIYGARHLAKHMAETMVPLVNLGDGSKFKSTPIRMMEAMIL